MMVLTLIDVIDSAVKIGLGAIISSYATYKITKSNHSNDRNKEIRSHKIKSIEFISENFQELINSYVNYKNTLGGVLKARDNGEGVVINQATIERLAEVDAALFVALKCAIAAQSRLSLMRAEKARNEIGTIIKLIGDVRNNIVREHKAPNSSEFEKFKEEVKFSVKIVLDELANLYENIP